MFKDDLATSRIISFQALQMIWLGLTLSTGIYFFIAWQDAQTYVLERTLFLASALVPNLLGMASCLLVFVFFMTLRMRRYSRATVPALLPQVQMDQARRQYVIPFILRMAVFESLALFGLLLELRTHDMNAMLSFGLFAMALQLWHFPTEAGIASWSGITESARP